MRKGGFCLVLLGAWGTVVQAADKVSPPKLGNFALPSSQQLGPLISLGQNILDPKVTQLYLIPDAIIGENQHFIDLTTNVIYGITDKFSVFLGLPFALSYRQNEHHSSGPEDLQLQGEYAYFAKSTSRYTQQGTLLANMTLPSGSANKQPPTGLGAVSFLLATTFNQMYCDWYGFVSPGVVITTSNEETKFGNRYLYQLGFGRNIFFKVEKWAVAWLLEIDGQYAEKDKIKALRNEDSGGNVLIATPSLFFATPTFILQGGVGLPLVQDLFGDQNKVESILTLRLTWTF